MRKKRMLAAVVPVMVAGVLAGCGVPIPALSSPVVGTSTTSLWTLGTARESASIAPCTASASTIEVTTNSPNSAVSVTIDRLVEGGTADAVTQTIPAGTGSVSVDVPQGCHSVSMWAEGRYCDDSFPIGEWHCEVVLPPTYRFTFTVAF